MGKAPNFKLDLDSMPGGWGSRTFISDDAAFRVTVQGISREAVYFFILDRPDKPKLCFTAEQIKHVMAERSFEIEWAITSIGQPGLGRLEPAKHIDAYRFPDKEELRECATLAAAALSAWQDVPQSLNIEKTRSVKITDSMQRYVYGEKQ